jgi:hypothetical protein
MTDTFCSMRSLGAMLGVSSHVVGRVLKGLGLRTPDGQPSPAAKESGLVTQAEGPQHWIKLWLWHEERTLAILEAANLENPSASPLSGDEK